MTDSQEENRDNEATCAEGVDSDFDPEHDKEDELMTDAELRANAFRWQTDEALRLARARPSFPATALRRNQNCALRPWRYFRCDGRPEASLIQLSQWQGFDLRRLYRRASNIARIG